MCPKAKPDSVQVVRFELQERERDLAEGLVLGNAVGNVLSGAGAIISGVGAALAPFSGALTALATLWIGDRALDEILAGAAAVGEAQKQEKIDEYSTEYGGAYTSICTFLQSMYASGGWEYCRTHTESFRNLGAPPMYGMNDSVYLSDEKSVSFDLETGGYETIGPAPYFLWMQLTKFLHMYFGDIWTARRMGYNYEDAFSRDRIAADWGGDIVEAFTTFYSYQEYLRDFYYYDGGSPFQRRVTWGQHRSGLGQSYYDQYVAALSPEYY
jgi:hypothetical protein